MVLLWLAPAVMVTLAAIAWVSWWGRESRDEVDRDERLRRLGAALDRTGIGTGIGTGRRTGRRRSRPMPGYVAPPASDDDRPRVTIRRAS